MELGKKIWYYRNIYILLIPALIWYILFAYVPMAGLSLAFKSYKANLGIWKSPFIGLANFVKVFNNPKFFRALGITLKINLGRLFITFPSAIILALLINEVSAGKLQKAYQWIFTFPHFLSWVVIASIATNILSYDGMVNSLLKLAGFEYHKFLGSESFFTPLVFITEIWKSAGWNSIIYMAAIAGIDSEQYEAADIDGASRLAKITRITLPSIAPTILVMFILATGNLMTTGFNQIFNLSNAAVQNVSQTLDMYIYNVTFKAIPDFGYSTAISMFRSIVNLILLVTADKLSRKFGGNGLLG